MKSRDYGRYEGKQKQKHKKRKGVWMLRKTLEEMKQELDLSSSEYHRLYRGVMCAVLKIRLQRSIRGRVTELQCNRGYRIMCKLTFAPVNLQYTITSKTSKQNIKTFLRKLYRRWHPSLYRAPLFGDATGYGIRKYIKWEDVNNNKYRRDFAKLHILANEYDFIVAFTGTKGTQYDSPIFATLCKYIQKGNKDDCIVLDSGYDSYMNCESIVESGRVPVIKPKSNYAKRGFNARCKMLVRYETDLDGFMEDYGKRNRGESIFAAMEKRDSSMLYAKKHEYQMAELLARVLYYNKELISSMI